MKKVVIWAVFFVLLFNVSAQVQDSAEDDLRFELINYDPSPVRPGGRFVGEFSVTNIYDDLITGLEIEFGERFPIAPENNKIITLGDLTPGETKRFTQTFFVSPFARDEGNIFYQYSRREFDREAAGVFDIEISDLDRDVEFDSIRTEPEKIGPGKKGRIIVDFQNSADSTLEEVTLRLNVTNPFTIFGTTNEKRIDSLIAKESESVEFEVVVDPNAEAGIYTLPLDITFYDTLRNLFSKSVSVGVLVDSEPEYELFVEESDALIYGTSPSITLAVSNTGTSDIKFLTVELVDGKNYQVVSNSKSYLGNLEPDDFETARFNVNLNSCSFCESKLSLRVKLSYKDSFNQDVLEEAIVEEKAYGRNKAIALGLAEQKGGLGSLIVYVLAIMFVYISYKEYRKTKNLPASLRKGLKRTLLYAIRFIAAILRNLRWKKFRQIPRKFWNFLKSK